MTRSYCWQHCASHNQRYAAVQDASDCLCGSSDDDYNTYGMAADSECNMQCTGNSNEICGGFWRQNVFDLGEFFNFYHLFRKDRTIILVDATKGCITHRDSSALY